VLGSWFYCIADGNRIIKSQTLTLLQLEHERLSQILSVLENEAEEIAISKNHSSRLIDQCLSYMLDYPDTCHHPKEDLIARNLRSAGAEEGAELEHDHELLRDLTLQTVRRFNSPDTSNSERSFYLREYAKAYRDHIEYENTTFFPKALSVLSQLDFDRIDFSLFDSPDPVFDQEHEQEFAALRKPILAL
jgi:hemerythrin-like domain-containing protein